MKNCITFFFLIICVNFFGQKQGNIWYFSDSTGIDFNNCQPSPLTNGQTPPSEGCATMCDTSGQLLFYTNSDIVWNRQHNPMPNNNLVPSNGTLSQVLIIPKPLSTNIFYIITTQIQGTASLNLEYHTIDMNLNGGLGDVINKNNVLTTATITEQVAATYHGNGTDIWIVVHEFGNDKFLCYLVTSAGINPSPITTNVGPAIIPCNSGFNARGEIKFSPNGLKVAFNNNGIGTNSNSDYLCLFDFDNNSGTISNPINLPYERGGFGLSFSPDNSKLYAATWKAFNFSAADSNKLFQFDISSNDSLTISNSKIILSSVPLINGSPFGSIKIGPDGKIYVAQSFSTYVGVINSPNQSGILCNYVSNGFYLGGKIVRIGLNNYIEYKTYCSDVGVNEINSKNSIAVFPNPFSTQTTLQTDNLLHNATLTVGNFFGQTVAQIKNISGQTITFNRDNLSSGLYFLRLTENNKILAVDKLVIIDK